MNRILFVILAALLILSIFVNGGCEPCEMVLAPINDIYHDIAIWADNSSPPQYFLYVVSGEPNTCHEFDSYKMTRAGNTTIIVEIFNLRCGTICGPIWSDVEHTIPLGSDFIPGGNYTVKVNDVTVTFGAGGMIWPAPIHDIEIWADDSLPPQYFVDVVSGKYSICEHFNSYNVTRAGNTTIIVDIFNWGCCTGCPPYGYEYSYVENTIPLGSDFIPGETYTVVVNNVTEIFVA